MNFVDTHCHIHFPDYALDEEEVYKESLDAGVSKMLVVGCTLEDSKLAIEFSKKHKNAYPTIGIHPHEARKYVKDKKLLEEFAILAENNSIVGVGETGLDFYYNNSPKKDQIKLLEFQLEIAEKHKLPLVLHIRDAFSEFWPVFDNFRGLKGVVHSFTADRAILEEVLSRELYVGLNGIMTFTKNTSQLEAASAVPVQKLLLETDAPFLTPKPFRGKICKPKHVIVTAEFLADLRGENLEDLSLQTTKNATELFSL